MNKHEKELKLDELKNIVENCKLCKEGKIGKEVFGEGNVNAEIMFVGEAPGKQESLTGRPFIGRSGKLLRSLINSIGLKENEVYITSPVKYLPLSGTPNKLDIEHAKIHFKEQVDIINPKIIVVLGATAAKALLSEPIQVTKMHSNIIKENNRIYFITFHPSAGLRFQKIKKLLQSDFLKLEQLISTH